MVPYGTVRYKWTIEFNSIPNKGNIYSRITGGDCLEILQTTKIYIYKKKNKNEISKHRRVSLVPALKKKDKGYLTVCRFDITWVFFNEDS